MKILWFTNTTSLYDQGKHHYHGGGWIESLERLVADDKGLELGVAFFHATDSHKVTQGNTTYFPIKRKNERGNPFRSILNNWLGSLIDSSYGNALKAIVNEFKPDLIHIFGTEGPFATIQEFTNIPVVIHLQGLINPYLNTYIPVNQSKLNFMLSPRFLKKNLIGSSPVFGIKRFENKARRETRILHKAKYVMGRTDWDKMIAKLYNPNVSYFHVNEVLRTPFYQTRPSRDYMSGNELSIVSTLSPTIYKGIDVVLRTAKKMVELSGIKFQWQVIGLDVNDSMLKHFEVTEGISHHDVNIECLGRKPPKELIALFATADVFVHPSYIDNSPNSVCEAQMMGLPTIACDVGGVSTLIKHGESGFLVPSNGVFELVHYLRKLSNDKKLAEDIGLRAMELANLRHDRVCIVNELRATYNKILS